MNSIALAYAGVHQIFQLALAAHEIGELNGLFCSIVDGPGKWGARLGRLVPSGTSRPLGSSEIPSHLITEQPWPLFLNRLGKRLFPRRRSDHLNSSRWFDHCAARWLVKRGARIFVGGETCALESLRTAGAMGMIRILDCAGVPSQSLDVMAQLAAREFSVTLPLTSNSLTMQNRKREELVEADLVFCCSEFQRRKLLEINPQIKRIEVIPLWTDVNFWTAGDRPRGRPHESMKLRVLYAGAVSIRKGVPYLLQALETLQHEASLTLVGSLAPEMLQILMRFRQHRRLPYVTKQELRNLAFDHDVLVMPTLGDSFGFIAMEAMAAGLPVIASSHCGAPLPDDSWRVPAANADAITARLRHYIEQPERLAADSERARAFAQQFTPERYRENVKAVFSELLFPSSHTTR